MPFVLWRLKGDLQGGWLHEVRGDQRQEEEGWERQQDSRDLENQTGSAIVVANLRCADGNIVGHQDRGLTRSSARPRPRPHPPTPHCPADIMSLLWILMTTQRTVKEESIDCPRRLLFVLTPSCSEVGLPCARMSHERTSTIDELYGQTGLYCHRRTTASVRAFCSPCSPLKQRLPCFVRHTLGLVFLISVFQQLCPASRDMLLRSDSRLH